MKRSKSLSCFGIAFSSFQHFLQQKNNADGGRKRRQAHALPIGAAVAGGVFTRSRTF